MGNDCYFKYNNNNNKIKKIHGHIDDLNRSDMSASCYRKNVFLSVVNLKAVRLRHVSLWHYRRGQGKGVRGKNYSIIPIFSTS